MHHTDQPSVVRPSFVLGALVLAIAAVLSFGLLVGQAQASTGGVGSSSLADAQIKKGQAKNKKGQAKKRKGGRVANKYSRLWSNVSRKNKRWATRTAECESNKNPKAIGYNGLYRGAFQFMRSTWRTSPKSPGGDPIRYSYKTQAYVAVRLKMRDGAGHWPVCG